MPRRLATINWLALSYAASWTDYGAPFQTGRYGLDDAGLVHLQGLLNGAALATVGQNAVMTMLTLPAGYRPLNQLMFPVVAYGSAQGVIATRLDITSGGLVQITQPFATAQNFAWVSLAGIYFYAEQ